MDPVTQGLLGAAAAQVGFSRRLGKISGLIGAVGGMLADADTLISSASDPLLSIEHHRGFTHSLVFIPVGGLIAMLPFLLRSRLRAQWKAVYGAATVGYATHGLLDACTTYGTQLLWPFSSVRVAWNCISIIDPIFTLALLIGVVLAARWRSAAPAGFALLFCLGYLGLGVVQRERALGAQEQIATARGQRRDRGEVFPTIGNNVVWRSLYQVGDSLYADRLRVPWVGETSWSPGSEVMLLREDELPPAISAVPRVRRDFRRFRWFADGWVARAPQDPEIIGDVRYSLATNRFDPIWGIRFRSHAGDVTTEWVNRTAERELGLRSLWEEIIGRSPDERTVPDG